jgi:hypothetical protein
MDRIFKLNSPCWKSKKLRIIKLHRRIADIFNAGASGGVLPLYIAVNWSHLTWCNFPFVELKSYSYISEDSFPGAMESATVNVYILSFFVRWEQTGTNHQFRPGQWLRQLCRRGPMCDLFLMSSGKRTPRHPESQCQGHRGSEHTLRTNRIVCRDGTEVRRQSWCQPVSDLPGLNRQSFGTPDSVSSKPVQRLGSMRSDLNLRRIDWHSWLGAETLSEYPSFLSDPIFVWWSEINKRSKRKFGYPSLPRFTNAEIFCEISLRSIRWDR